MLNLVTFKELLEKSIFLKIAAQAFETGDFLTRFLAFCGSVSDKIFDYKKKTRNLIEKDKLLFEHIRQTFSLRVFLSFCLIFSHFQPGVAY